MRWPAPVNFRAQAIIIAAASLAVTGLAIFIVRNVVFTAESKILADSQQMCAAACEELKVQYRDREAYVGDPLKNLPKDAQEVSLLGISTTVLQSYKGIKGGMYLTETGRIMGYAFPTAESKLQSDLTEEERNLVRSLARRAAASTETITESEWRDRDLIVGAAVRSGALTLWTMRRIAVVRNPLMAGPQWWFVALAFSTILGVAGIISIWYLLYSGIDSINIGLRKLESNFSFRLPLIRGDLGQVARSINRMAERRMALEEQLRQQDRLAALGKVVAGVAHEVRNPLNSIKLTLQLLERRLKKGIEASGEIQECLQEIDRLDMIVARLLAFGRPALTNRHTQEIAPLIRQAIKIVHEPIQQNNVRIIAEDIEMDLIADVDGSQVVQVLINLLLNAVEASPPSGTVRLSAGNIGSNICIKVADEGARIPDDVRQHVFDAYYTTKPAGSGLGLAVSREIVVNHGGALEFESDDSGTTFIMLLPIERSEPDET
jgi:signal transduction histidine kinase